MHATTQHSQGTSAHCIAFAGASSTSCRNAMQPCAAGNPSHTLAEETEEEAEKGCRFEKE